MSVHVHPHLSFLSCLEGLQRNMEIPLPASTQWEIVEETAEWIDPVYQELIRQAAQGEVLHNDDTTMKVLAMMKENREAANKEDKPERRGIFTSGIVSTNAGQKIALFFTGRKHAGENLTAVLAERATFYPFRKLDERAPVKQAISLLSAS